MIISDSTIKFSPLLFNLSISISETVSSDSFKSQETFTLEMVSEITAEMVHEVTGKSNSRFSSKKKNQGKIPKKIHKAEREKLKRDHLNELFLDLDNALETKRQNNGKASILVDATRLLQELLLQVECLRKENTSLLSESGYVAIERNELKEETSVLEAEIEQLQTKLQDRIHPEHIWNATVAQPQNNSTSQLPDVNLSLPVTDNGLQPPVMGPILVIPLHDLHGYSDPVSVPTPLKPSLNVSRPHARYPTPSDSWSSQLLDKQQQIASQEQLNNCTVGEE